MKVAPSYSSSSQSIIPHHPCIIGAPQPREIRAPASTASHEVDHEGHHAVSVRDETVQVTTLTSVLSSWLSSGAQEQLAN